MGVVCRFVGSKRSETKRYVISNCPIMSRMKSVEQTARIEKKENAALAFSFSVRD